MRLTCPRCSAQYEIPDQVIPAAGREVECSACAHVWHQPGAMAAENPVKSAPPAPVPPPEPAPEPPEAFDLDQRPILNRKLDDSVLSILREEAARELTARQSDTQTGPGGDHIPAMDELQPPQATSLPPVSDPSDWPVATVILPGAPLDPDTLARPEPTPQPVAPAPEPAVPPAPMAPLASPQVDLPEPVASITDPEPDTQRLPDAARLAATLTRPMPMSEPSASPVVAAPAQPDATPPPHPVPALRPKPTPRAGHGYAMGFGLAAMLALGLVAFYALAPRIQPGESGGPVSAWRQDLDRGRLWLHDRFRDLTGQ